MEQLEGGIAPMEIWQDATPSFEGFRDWFLQSRPEAILCITPDIVIEWLARPR